MFGGVGEVTYFLVYLTSTDKTEPLQLVKVLLPELSVAELIVSVHVPIDSSNENCLLCRTSKLDEPLVRMFSASVFISSLYTGW